MNQISRPWILFLLIFFAAAAVWSNDDSSQDSNWSLNTDAGSVHPRTLNINRLRNAILRRKSGISGQRRNLNKHASSKTRYIVCWTPFVNWDPSLPDGLTHIQLSGQEWWTLGLNFYEEDSGFFRVEGKGCYGFMDKHGNGKIESLWMFRTVPFKAVMEHERMSYYTEYAEVLVGEGESLETYRCDRRGACEYNTKRECFEKGYVRWRLPCNRSSE